MSAENEPGIGDIAPGSGQGAGAGSGWPSKLGAALKCEPVPLEPPAADLREMRPVERAAESLRYVLLRAEYWLSPGGSLRAWTRLAVYLGLMLGITALIIVPPATLLLTGAVTLAAKLGELARNLAILPAWVATAALALVALRVLLKLLLGR